MKTALTATLLLCLSTGLGFSAEPDPGKTTDYYMDHPDEREAVLKDCAGRYGEMQFTVESCALAFAAKQQAAAIAAVEQSLNKLKTRHGQ
ncbi:MAG: hypothetical protein FWD68_08590 [Alphaproteobacteria bacterium]|nr:hypothetical protein [Alphaproteobacteria bacterium]